ncbi:MAG: hypothetical protein ACR5KV_03945 [Wolbachia sp.]
MKAEVIESEELIKSSVFNNKIEKSQRSKTIREKIVEVILGITNKNSDKGHSSSAIQNQSNNRSSQVDIQDSTTTSKLSSSSDSEIDSLETSVENLKSPVSSRRNSLTSVISTFLRKT